MSLLSNSTRNRKRVFLFPLLFQGRKGRRLTANRPATVPHPTPFQCQPCYNALLIIISGFEQGFDVASTMLHHLRIIGGRVKDPQT